MPDSEFGCKVTKQTWESVEIACFPQVLLSPNTEPTLLKKTDAETHEKQSPMVTVQFNEESDKSKGIYNAPVNPNTIKGMPISKSTSHSKWFQSSNGEENVVDGSTDEWNGVEEEEDEEEVTKYMLIVRERYSDTLIQNTTGESYKRGLGLNEFVEY